MTLPHRLQSRTRFIDLTLVLGALMLGAYLVSTGGGPTQAEIDTRTGHLFPSFSADDIESISIENGKDKTRIKLLQKSSSEEQAFFMVAQGSTTDAPVLTRADDAAVSELTSSLDYATWLRTLEQDSKLSNKELGFESPQAELRLSAGPRSSRLILGKEAPTPKGAVYARVEGPGTHSVTGVVKGQLLDGLLRGEQVFRGTALFPYARSRTTRLAIKQRGREISLQADSLGFYLDANTDGAPENARPTIRADRQMSDLIFFQLARGSIESFISPGQAKELILGDEEHLEITQESEPLATYNVLLGGNCPDHPEATVALRQSPDEVAGCVTKTILPSLRLRHSALSSRTAVALTTDEIDHVTIKAEGRSLDLIRDREKFKLLSRDHSEVDGETATEFLQALSEGKLTLLESKPSELKKYGSLTVKGQSRRSPQSFAQKELAPPDPTSAPELQELHLSIFTHEGEVLLHREDDDTWFSVPGWLKWAFSVGDAWAKDRHLSDWSADDIMSVELLEPAGTKRKLILRGPERTPLLLTETKEEPADGPYTNRLLDELAHLKAVRFVGEVSPKPAPSCTELRFKLGEAGEEERQERLWIGRRIQGGSLAWASFTDGAFVLSHRARRVLESPLGDRSAAFIRPASLVEISISFEGREYRFSRRAGLLLSDGGEALDELAQPLEESLKALQILAVVPPLSAQPKRGSAPLITIGTVSETGEKRHLRIGDATVWEGLSARVAWIEGNSENYLVSQSSLATLLDLL